MKGVSDEMFKYIFGIIIVNILMKEDDQIEEDGTMDEEKKEEEKPKGKEKEMVTEAKKETFRAGKQSDRAFLVAFFRDDPDIAPLGKIYYNYLKVLIQGEFEEIYKFAQLPNFIFILKTVLHFGVLNASFADKGTHIVSHVSDVSKWE